MQQAYDFLEETEVLFNVLENFQDEEFEKPTLFKAWTINDILVHLHFWNLNADASLNEPDELDKTLERFFAAIQTGQLRPYENQAIKERGQVLLKIWYELSQKLCNDFSKVDPKLRVKWAGPDMSARTCISARQMEVWAHGQAIFDSLAIERSESDRIKNIVFLGINAFGWSHSVHGLAVPEEMPFLKLKAPSGEVWEFGDASNANHISGEATEFSQVVTQTRNIADTHLNVSGHVSKVWMQNAQCFAGPPETPPAPGVRKKAILS